MERYNINLCNGWAIENVKYIDKDIKVEKNKLEVPFGEIEIFQNEIVWIFEPFPVKNEWIELCSKIEIFNKRVVFVVNLLKDEWEKIDEFEGTFIDALKYIQKVFKW